MRWSTCSFAGLRLEPDRGPVEHWYSLTASVGGAGTFDVVRDDELLAQDQRAGDALGWVVWDVNRSAAAASGAHLLFHAGALEADGAGVLLPGTSGSGKSTLTAGLVTRAGLGYLTDELAALDLRRGLLLPYAKPITVKRRQLRGRARAAPRPVCGARCAVVGGRGVAGGRRRDDAGGASDGPVRCAG